jgi:hypothetical protein
MKEHLIIKGMNFIGGGIIEVKLIDNPKYKVKQVDNNIDYKNMNTVFKSVNKIVAQEKDNERIIFIPVDEWKKNNYNFASEIVLGAVPEYEHK